MSEPGSLFVVIPTAGACTLLPRTLASLAECELPADYAQTIVVENGPPGGAAEAVRQAPASLQAKYVHVERANKSNALNCIFADFEDADLIYLVDDDVRFAPHVLVDFSTAAAGKTSGYVFGGPLRIDSELPPPEEYLELLPGSMKGWEPAAASFDPLRNFFLGANWAVFAGDVRAAGGFDPRFGPGSPLNATGQEWTMQTALREHGARFTYLPNAVVWHHVDFSRFSPDFLLRRKYRGGLEAGIKAADRQRDPQRFRDRIRFPGCRARWRCLRHGWAARRLRKNPPMALKHELAREHARGFLESYHQTLRAPLGR